MLRLSKNKKQNETVDVALSHTDSIKALKNNIRGDLYFDNTHRIIYSTDASAYKEKPVAVAYPKDIEDVKKIISFVNTHTVGVASSYTDSMNIIPRGAGTSLAGQVTGKGIVVDVSKYMNKILHFDAEKKLVTVEPGVILSELNLFLKPYGLFFGPETSTENRCTIGGMSGNNACGLHSLIYGSTRDYTHSITTILSDNSEVVFGELSKDEFHKKIKLQNLEGEIYRKTYEILSDNSVRKKIEEQYPDKEIPRRNTGYALDLLIENEVFKDSSKKSFNFSKLLSGSEGTLAFISEITLNLVDLPPENKALLTVHFDKLEDAFYANLIALKYKPGAVELMDRTILDLTKKTKGLEQNRFFLKGEPEAILIIEFARETKEEIQKIAKNLEKEMRSAGYGYHFPLIWDKDVKKVWDLRRAGLGVLSNMPGDAKPVSLVEDTAIKAEKLPEYIKDFQKLLKKHSLECVYHAHIGTGELHLRPILNLKDKKDVALFRTVAFETAKLVKKYKGSLSGEHGDGRLRGEFIPLMYGEKIYNIFKEIKHIWDEKNIFNPGKITDTPPMNEFLRYVPGQETKDIETVFDFSNTGGFLRAAEKCNGSGDCLKPVSAGGTMCPSYKASKNETQSTRARANMLRDVITNEHNPFNNKDLYNILNLCLSCKACKTECPSNVDVTKLKAEFLQHYYDQNGVPLRSRLIANITKINRILSIAPAVSNFFLKSKLFSVPMMKLIGFSSKRKMPVLSKKTLRKLTPKSFRSKFGTGSKEDFLQTSFARKVYLFADEFTNYNDADIGIKAIQLLNYFGYEVRIPNITESGRTYLSKGLVRKAKSIAEKNLNILKNIISEETPLLGIEPSTILSFRDEYPDFFKEGERLKNVAKEVAKNSLMIDEFLAEKMKAGNIKKKQFTKDKKHIKLHGHCQQKAVASTDATKYILSFPKNYTVEEIPSGCCGMAGSFGYEKEHYELSMKIGETVLFPAVRKTSSETIIAAPGTSCRCQIKDGTDRDAVHPVEVLWGALITHD
ncbi:MAG: FAD-binding protein [Bacteroidales bacterium]|nr:FAD-binding protein [Bacteroidales bacterium]